LELLIDLLTYKKGFVRDEAFCCFGSPTQLPRAEMRRQGPTRAGY